MSTDTFTEALPLLPIERIESSNKDDTIINDEHSTKPHGYSIWVAICFALNYSIGAGILGLPYEFYNTGYLLSSIIIIFMGLLSYITNMYIVDAMLRAEAITTIAKQSYSIQKPQIISNGHSVKEALSHQISSQRITQNYIIQRNEYQLSELIGIFCGIWWRIAYDVTFGLSTLIGLWSYNVLFGVSLSRNFGLPMIAQSCNMEEYGEDNPGCRVLYSIYVLIFWLWTMVITLVDFQNQQWLQIAATIARVIIISLMLFTAIGLMYSVYYYDGNDYIIDDAYTFSSDISAWKWSGIAYMIAIASFAFGSQFCVMDVVEPLSAKNKQTKQHFLWASSTAICAIVYILCGVIISLYFGTNTQDPCTLAWEGFMGFTSTELSPAPIWAFIISWIVVLLPAIDIGSSFPLIATTLANTLEAILLSVVSNDKKQVPEEIASCYQSCYDQRYVVFIKVSLCTLVSGVALLEWDFELILALSGAFKLLAVYLAPCFLEWKSRQFMKDICMDNDNDVADTFVTKHWISHVSWLFIITALSFVAFFAVFVYTILDFL